MYTNKFTYKLYLYSISFQSTVKTLHRAGKKLTRTSSCLSAILDHNDNAEELEDAFAHPEDYALGKQFGPDLACGQAGSILVQDL